MTWRHPRSKHWHQLDLIITRRSAMKGVQLTRTFHSADCDTDHSLVCCKFKLQPKKIHHSRQVGKPHIDVSKTLYPDKAEEFTYALSKAFSSEPPYGSAKERWDNIRDTVYSTDTRIFGKKQTKNNELRHTHASNRRASQCPPGIQAFTLPEGTTCIQVYQKQSAEVSTAVRQ